MRRLVQAEAPPGALFSSFKAVLASDNLDSSDVAFYFVHWLTDLAGAVPAPLKGSEKFVVQFPHFVLESFIHSFPVINQLADRTETEVFETYLSQRWRDLHTHLGDVPTGDDAIALMRLVVQAQTTPLQRHLLASWDTLSPADRDTLGVEMARAGVVGQSFERTPVAPGGPAFLVYYSPAFVRTAQGSAAALRILAELYRQARAMWPLSAASAGKTVTVRIDQLKDREGRSVEGGHAFGDGWLLLKRNEMEGVVEERPLDAINALAGEGATFRVLAFWQPRASPPSQQPQPVSAAPSAQSK